MVDKKIKQKSNPFKKVETTVFTDKNEKNLSFFHFCHQMIFRLNESYFFVLHN